MEYFFHRPKQTKDPILIIAMHPDLMSKVLSSCTVGYVHLIAAMYETIISITRTTHVHDASRRAVPVCMCALRMRVAHGAQEQLRLNQT